MSNKITEIPCSNCYSKHGVAISPYCRDTEQECTAFRNYKRGLVWIPSDRGNPKPVKNSHPWTQ